jgi:hypothetical protein
MRGFLKFLFEISLKSEIYLAENFAATRHKTY